MPSTSRRPLIARSWWPALVALAIGLVAPGPPPLRADEPKPAPDLTGYKTVADALTPPALPTRAGRPGQTGYLGVSLLRDGQGRLAVDEIQADSPAARAGVRTGDIVVRFENEPVKSPEAFRDALQSRGPGDFVKIELTRGEAIVEVQATLAATSRPRAANAQRAYLGLVLGEVKEGEGVKIDQVAPGSPALTAGFQAGDQIFQVEGVDFINPAKLGEILTEKKPGDEFEVSVRRGAEVVTLRPRLAAPDQAQGSGPGGRQGQGQGPITIPL